MTVSDVRLDEIGPSATGLVLEARNVAKHYPVDRNLLGRARGALRAVDGVTLGVRPGTTHAIVGESGCGKSTLGRMLVGLEPPTSGEIVFEGRPVSTMNRAMRTRFHRNVQIVMQDPYSSLDPRMTVGEIVREPLDVHPDLVPRSRRDERVRELLELVGLNPDWTERYPHQFSGGQRQRVSIARGLALNPSVLILDEAVSALDVSVQAQVINLFQRLQRELGLAYVFITHDVAVVRQIATEASVMYLGRVVENASADELFERFRHPYTQALMSAVPRVRTDGTVSERIHLTGELPSAANPPSGCNFRTRCPIAGPACAEVDPELSPEPHSVACVTPLS